MVKGNVYSGPGLYETENKRKMGACSICEEDDQKYWLTWYNDETTDNYKVCTEHTKYHL